MDNCEHGQGLSLVEQYFTDVALPLLEKDFSEYMPYLAAGLVGPGSECWGFDDAFSRDHDWGPQFCLWVSSSISKEALSALHAWYKNLPVDFDGMPSSNMQAPDLFRYGVIKVADFFYVHAGLSEKPDSWQTWNKKELVLSMMTNGKVFFDNAGEFTAWRKHLQGFYPEELRLKKLAARCFISGQSGQYNLPRLVKRKDIHGIRWAEFTFASTICSLYHLLQKAYCPYPKWELASVARLDATGLVLAKKIQELLTAPEQYKVQLAEDIAQFVEKALLSHFPLISYNGALMPFSEQLNKLIRDASLAQAPLYCF